MKKISISLFLIFVMFLTGCHQHNWNEATCTTPKTCTDCEEIEGEALGRTWIEATCTEAKTCTVCGLTEGEALGHQAEGISCTKDGFCTRCNQTVAATGHQYSQATCTAPQKCSVCGETKGKALGHSTSEGVCSRCGLEVYKTVKGKGDDFVSNITLGDGIYRVHFTHSGSSNFIVKAYNTGSSYDLLVNEIGKYDGYVYLSGEGPYSFEITAGGSWTYKVERLTQTSKTSFSGKGDYVTDIFSASSGTWKFTHNGSSNFMVKVYTTSGYDLLINEIGKYDGKKIVEVPSGSNVFFEIIADGKWTASPAL